MGWSNCRTRDDNNSTYSTHSVAERMADEDYPACVDRCRANYKSCAKGCSDGDNFQTCVQECADVYDACLNKCDGDVQSK